MLWLPAGLGCTSQQLYASCRLLWALLTARRCNQRWRLSVLLTALGSADASARILASWNGTPTLINRLSHLMMVRRCINS